MKWCCGAYVALRRFSGRFFIPTVLAAANLEEFHGVYLEESEAHAMQQLMGEIHLPFKPIYWANTFDKSGIPDFVEIT